MKPQCDEPMRSGYDGDEPKISEKPLMREIFLYKSGNE